MRTAITHSLVAATPTRRSGAASCPSWQSVPVGGYQPFSVSIIPRRCVRPRNASVQVAQMKVSWAKGSNLGRAIVQNVLLAQMILQIRAPRLHIHDPRLVAQHVSTPLAGRHRMMPVHICFRQLTILLCASAVIDGVGWARGSNKRLLVLDFNLSESHSSPLPLDVSNVEVRGRSWCCQSNILGSEVLCCVLCWSDWSFCCRHGLALVRSCRPLLHCLFFYNRTYPKSFYLSA